MAAADGVSAIIHNGGVFATGSTLGSGGFTFQGCDHTNDYCERAPRAWDHEEIKTKLTPAAASGVILSTTCHQMV